MKKVIPNFITSFNLLSGVFSIFFAFNGQLDWAGYLIFFAAFFDFLDGFSAHLLKSFSEIGKELDSLSDLVSFGVAPGFIVFKVLMAVNRNPDLTQLQIEELILLFIPFLIPVFAGFRLARFNVLHAKEKSFTGMPVPANGIFHAGVGILFFHSAIITPFSPLVMTLLIDLNLLIFCYLMVSHIKMLSLKVNSYNISQSIFQYLILFFAIIISFSMQWHAIPLIIYFYILLSMVKNRFFSKE